MLHYVERKWKVERWDCLAAVQDHPTSPETRSCPRPKPEVGYHLRLHTPEWVQSPPSQEQTDFLDPTGGHLSANTSLGVPLKHKIKIASSICGVVKFKNLVKYESRKSSLVDTNKKNVNHYKFSSNSHWNFTYFSHLQLS